MNKSFRAWDGDAYWYSDENLRFIEGYKVKNLHEASFSLEDIDQFTGKVDSNSVKIYENDIICNPMIDPDKNFQVIWSYKECGFRKVPFEKDLPETKIDEAFMNVVGTVKRK